MKSVMNFIIFVFLSVSLLVNPAVNACTIFSVSDGKKVLFGGNEDQKPNSSFLVVDKRGAFGVVYFATPWKQWPLILQTGINEMGLCYDSNWIPPEKLNPHPERKTQHEWAMPQFMKEASTVEEVLSKISTYNWGDSVSYQVHFADKTGDAAVIHPGKNGELTYTRKPKGKDYLISTNFNLVQLDKGNWSCRRYKTADKMLSKIGTKNDLTVEFMASVLKATSPRGSITTLYAAVYDLQKLRIYLYYNGKFDTPYVLDVKKELAKTTSYRKISLEDLISSMDKMKENDK